MAGPSRSFPYSMALDHVSFLTGALSPLPLFPCLGFWRSCCTNQPPLLILCICKLLLKTVSPPLTVVLPTIRDEQSALLDLELSSSFFSLSGTPLPPPTLNLHTLTSFPQNEIPSCICHLFKTSPPSSPKVSCSLLVLLLSSFVLSLLT